VRQYFETAMNIQRRYMNLKKRHTNVTTHLMII